MLASEVKSQPKKFWRYAKSKLKVKERIAELEVDGAVDDAGKQLYAKSNQEKAEVLSTFFQSVFTDEPAGQLPHLERPEITQQLLDAPVEESTVLKLLKQLDTTKTPGPDGIHPVVLRELSDVIAAPLQIIFNTSLQTGQLPSVWKQANISAIFKKGEKKKPSNYRPVSLTCITCKIMEKILRQRIIEHMTINSLLTKQQYGFLSGRSTTQQLTQVLDHWSSILDKGSTLDVIYFDFKKAFDTVPHKRLLHKLKNYGIPEHILNWLAAFLTDRKQRVGVNGVFSEWAEVISGIPQGSVMGPVMFVVYINDLPDCIKSCLFLFADDTKLYREIRSPIDIGNLQIDISALEDWAKLWLLLYHPDKCVYMSVCNSGTADSAGSYTMSSVGGDAQQPLKRVRSEKDLGVTVDSALKFDNHVAAVVSKATRIAAVIRRTFTYMDIKTFNLLFKALVRPHLEYAQAAWHPHLRKHIDALERVQRRATKQVPALKNLSYTERLQRLKLPTLAFRRLRGDMIETYKHMHNLYDTNTCRQILHKSTNHRTRGHTLKLRKEPCKRNVGLHSFSQRVVNNWNSLPEHIASAPSIHAFENRLDRYWANHPLRLDHEQRESYIHRGAPNWRRDLDLEEGNHLRPEPP